MGKKQVVPLLDPKKFVSVKGVKPPQISERARDIIRKVQEARKETAARAHRIFMG